MKKLYLLLIPIILSSLTIGGTIYSNRIQENCVSNTYSYKPDGSGNDIPNDYLPIVTSYDVAIVNENTIAEKVKIPSNISFYSFYIDVESIGAIYKLGDIIILDEATYSDKINEQFYNHYCQINTINENLIGVIIIDCFKANVKFEAPLVFEYDSLKIYGKVGSNIYTPSQFKITYDGEGYLYFDCVIDNPNRNLLQSKMDFILEYTTTVPGLSLNKDYIFKDKNGYYVYKRYILSPSSKIQYCKKVYIEIIKEYTQYVIIESSEIKKNNVIVIQNNDIDNLAFNNLI